jgi:hypothetical protein
MWIGEAWVCKLDTFTYKNKFEPRVNPGFFRF